MNCMNRKLERSGNNPALLSVTKPLLRVAAVIILTILSTPAQGQIPRANYIVLTFEERYKTSPHGTTTYHWIQPMDSAVQPLLLSALFLSVYSKDNLEAICNETMTDPFLVTESTDFTLPKTHLASRDSLAVLLARNRKRTQRIQKAWLNGQKAWVDVYVTPIAGSFCVSRLHRKQANGEDYDGLIFLPSAHFQVIKAFWATEAAKRISATDFSRVHYSILATGLPKKK